MLSPEAPEPKRPLPPYLPFKTFENALASWRGGRLPNRIDRSVLGSYAGTMQSWVLSSLRYFKLIELDGTPTNLLRTVTKLDDKHREDGFRHLLAGGYPFIFTDDFDLANATPSQLRERFETSGAHGETLVKAISFFTALAKAAGVSLSPFMKTRQRRAASGRKRRPNGADGVQGGPARPEAVNAAQTTSLGPVETLYELLDEAMSPTEKSAVWTLIQYVKKRESKP